MTAGRAVSAHVLDLLYVAISTDFSVSNFMARTAYMYLMCNAHKDCKRMVNILKNGDMFYINIKGKHATESSSKLGEEEELRIVLPMAEMV